MNSNRDVATADAPGSAADFPRFMGISVVLCDCTSHFCKWVLQVAEQITYYPEKLE
jgi:hypothetical protein